jgi:hypothetical protein
VQRIRSILVGIREAAICCAEVDSDDVGHWWLLDFDFRWREDRHLGRHQSGEFNFVYAPAFMAENALRCLAVGRDIAEQLDGGGVTGGNAGGRPFDAVDYGAESDVLGERLLALIVQITHRGSDLVVGVGGDVFHKEVDEARIALEERKDLDRAVGGADLDRRLSDGFRHGFFGVAEGFGYLFG